MMRGALTDFGHEGFRGRANTRKALNLKQGVTGSQHIWDLTQPVSQLQATARWPSAGSGPSLKEHSTRLFRVAVFVD